MSVSSEARYRQRRFHDRPIDLGPQAYLLAMIEDQAVNLSHMAAFSAFLLCDILPCFVPVVVLIFVGVARKYLT